MTKSKLGMSIPRAATSVTISTDTLFCENFAVFIFLAEGSSVE